MSTEKRAKEIIKEMLTSK